MQQRAAGAYNIKYGICQSNTRGYFNRTADFMNFSIQIVFFKPLG